MLAQLLHLLLDQPRPARNRVQLIGQHLHIVHGQLRARLPNGGLHRGRLLRGLRLPSQRPQLLAQLIGEVMQPVQVGLHVQQLALGFFFSTPMLQHTSGFLNERAAIFRLGFQDLRQPALSHDHVHFPADAGIAQQFLHVHEACFGSVDLVLAGAIAEHAAGDGDFRIVDGKCAIGVIDGEGDFRASQRLALTRAGEDDIFHLAAAQGFRGVLPHHPGQSVHHIGLPGSVGSHHGADAGF